jgi:hypothetical protein
MIFMADTDLNSERNDTKQVPRPRFQFKLRALLILPLAFAAGLLCLHSLSLLPTSTWSGQRQMDVDVEVTQAATGRPIDGVLIELVTLRGKRKAAAHTGPDGRATVSGWFDVSGRVDVFSKIGSVVTEPLGIRLTVDGQLRVDRPFVHYWHQRGPQRPRLQRFQL